VTELGKKVSKSLNALANKFLLSAVLGTTSKDYTLNQLRMPPHPSCLPDIFGLTEKSLRRATWQSYGLRGKLWWPLIQPLLKCKHFRLSHMLSRVTRTRRVRTTILSSSQTPTLCDSTSIPAPLLRTISCLYHTTPTSSYFSRTSQLQMSITS
jgi:hypothetical protein